MRKYHLTWLTDVSLPNIAAAVAIGMVAGGAASAQTGGTTRSWTTWPFSQNSPWNMPIGSKAKYGKKETVLGALSSNFNNMFGTTQIQIASTSDPLVKLEDNTNLDYTGSNTKYENSLWYIANAPSGSPTFCYATSTQDVTAFEDSSVDPTVSGFPYDYNPWSVTPVGSYVAPSANYSNLFYMPAGICGSPDLDGLTSIIQPPPSHFAVDLYAPIVLPNVTPFPIVISSAIGTYYDLTGDGTGYWNGRRASMFPTIAGLIRDGEIANGTIPHAVAIVVDEDSLTNVNGPVWPANSYDQPSSGGYGNCAKCLPMGTLLAIPPGIVAAHTFYTAAGLAIATAAQNYGVYIVDAGAHPTNGNPGEVAWLAQLGDPDANGQSQGYLDLQWIQTQLREITNNSATKIGGGGTPIAPLAPPFSGD